MRKWIAATLLCLAVTCVWAQDQKAAQANELFLAGKRVDALPLYQDLANQYPSQMLYQERLADCLGAEAVQLSDPAEIKAVRIRQRDAAKRAVELGDTAEYVKMMANLDPDQPLFSGIAGAGKTLLMEAEKAYAAGDFQTAMAKYTAAAEADPHLYEAPLYAGDTAYVQHDMPTAAQWFARAIGVDPNRETAYRYWGDAILKYGSDPAAAREKFIEAVVAEPYSKLAWQGINQWAKIENAVVQAPKIDRPAPPTRDPNNPSKTIITISPQDTAGNQEGNVAWTAYSIERALYQGDEFKKQFPNESTYRHTLKEEHDALSAAVAIIKERNIGRDSLDESLRNLLDVSDAGMLDCWILISGSDDGIAQDYPAYRDQHRQLLHDYLSRFVIHDQGVGSAQ